jgi:hypothetical protein
MVIDSPNANIADHHLTAYLAVHEQTTLLSVNILKISLTMTNGLVIIEGLITLKL